MAILPFRSYHSSMAKRVCPWWLGWLLASRLRRWRTKPAQLLEPYVREGMTVLEPGPGMGFFTVELARMVGTTGRVVVVDIQEKMLAGLRRRLAKAGLLERVDVRLVKPDSMALDDLGGKIDFVLAFAVVHEMPSAATFFSEVAATLKPDARLLLAEPSGHVREAAFAEELKAANDAGLEVLERPTIRRSHAAVLQRRKT